MRFIFKPVAKYNAIKTHTCQRLLCVLFLPISKLNFCTFILATMLETDLYNKGEFRFIPFQDDIPIVLKTAHQDIHSGRNTSAKQTGLNYYVPLVNELIALFTQRCIICVPRKKRKCHILPIHFTNTRKVGIEVCIDCFNMDLDVCGFHYVLVIVEILSLFVWAAPLHSKRAEEVRERLDEVFMRENISPQIRTDNGGEFRGSLDVYCEWLQARKIKRITPYNPRSNVHTHKII